MPHCTWLGQILNAPPPATYTCAHTQEVLRLSRELALRTLQLEMEYAYRALEDEALDIAGFDVKGACAHTCVCV